MVLVIYITSNFPFFPVDGWDGKKIFYGLVFSSTFSYTYPSPSYLPPTRPPISLSLLLSTHTKTTRSNDDFEAFGFSRPRFPLSILVLRKFLPTSTESHCSTVQGRRGKEVGRENQLKLTSSRRLGLRKVFSFSVLFLFWICSLIML